MNSLPFVDRRRMMGRGIGRLAGALALSANLIGYFAHLHFGFAPR